jgi:hypothetical protein
VNGSNDPYMHAPTYLDVVPLDDSNVMTSNNQLYSVPDYTEDTTA